MMKWFDQITDQVVKAAGSLYAVVAAVVGTLIWAAVGPIFSFSDTWQLWANTLTTILTFIMVFVIQHSQNRDGAAIQAKLDELIRASEARNTFIGLDKRSESEIEKVRDE